MSLYGIESEDDCRAKIDELLAMVSQAKGRTDKAAMATLKSRLKDYYNMGNSDRGRSKMSQVECQWFFPAIHKASVDAPNLNEPETWANGLYLVELDLNDLRPLEPAGGISPAEPIM